MDNFTVYKITNLVNGIFYIGVTQRNIKDRFNSHVTRSNKLKNRKDSDLAYAMKIDSIGCFKIEPIKVFQDKEEAYQYETDLIYKYHMDSRIVIYNKRVTGVPTCLKGDDSYKRIKIRNRPLLLQSEIK